MRKTLRGAAVAMLVALAVGTAAAPARAQFSVDRVLTFGVPSERLRAQVREVPAAREVAAGDFVMAGADLDGDGKPEAIVLERRPADCRNVRCGLLVMRGTASGGAEVLLLTRVAYPLALTREKVNGYHALVALDGHGGIAIGDARDGPRAGRPLVYAMTVGAPKPDASAASRPPAAPDAAAPAPRGGKPTLQDVVETIAPAAGDKDYKPNWTSMEKIPGIKIRQSRDALIQTPRSYRRGGQVVLEHLGSTSVTWDGSSDGAFTADVQTAVPLRPDRYAEALRQQFVPSAKLKQTRGGCPASEFNRDSAVFQLDLPNRKPMFLYVGTTRSNNKGNTTIQVSSEVENWWAC